MLRQWSNPWIHAAGMMAIALLLILQRGFSEFPIFGDRAYFTYVGQAVLRGEPYYQTTFMGYPPFAAMLSATAMWLGQWFDVPTYLAPRYLSVGVAALTSLGAIAYWQVLFVGFLVGMMQSPLQPTRFTLIMDLVGRQNLSSANALNVAALMGDTTPGDDPPGDRTLAAAATETLCFSVVLPDSAANTLQTKTNVTTFTFEPEQTLNNP